MAGTTQLLVGNSRARRLTVRAEDSKHEAHRQRYRTGRVYMVVELIPDSTRPPSADDSGLHVLDITDEPSSVRNALPGRRVGT